MKKPNIKDVLFTTVDVVKQTLSHLHNTLYLSIFVIGLTSLSVGQDWFGLRTFFLPNFSESYMIYLNSEGVAFLIIGAVGLTMSFFTKEIGRKIIENGNANTNKIIENNNTNTDKIITNTNKIIAVLERIEQKLPDKTSGI